MVSRSFAFDGSGERLRNTDRRDGWRRRGSGNWCSDAFHSNVGKSAAIGAGVGGTAGALYDVFGR